MSHYEEAEKSVLMNQAFWNENSFVGFLADGRCFFSNNNGIQNYEYHQHYTLPALTFFNLLLLAIVTLFLSSFQFQGISNRFVVYLFVIILYD